VAAFLAVFFAATLQEILASFGTTLYFAASPAFGKPITSREAIKG